MEQSFVLVFVLILTRSRIVVCVSLGTHRHQNQPDGEFNTSRSTVLPGFGEDSRSDGSTIVVIA